MKPNAGTADSASLVTDANGTVRFEWELTHPEEAKLTLVRESSKPDFNFVYAECTVHNRDTTVVGEPVRTESAGAGTDLADFASSIRCENEHGTEVASGPGASLSVTLDSASVECTITNTHVPPPALAHLEVVKRLKPSDDPGIFDLLVDDTAFATGVGDGGTTGPLEFERGTYRVSERISAPEAHAISLDDYDISTTCVNQTTGKTIAAGVGTVSDPVSVRLRSAANVVCTITNTRKVGPAPEPPTPPDDCLDVENGIPECGDVALAPRLSVVKQMPVQARVGDRVPIAITVENVGHQTARQVRLHETPPAGGRIVAVADHGSLQRDGTAVWNLGDLAPGEKRTVHATMLVTQTGLQTDTAVAAAANADTAVDVASLRAAPALRPPPFTG